MKSIRALSGRLSAAVLLAALAACASVDDGHRRPDTSPYVQSGPFPAPPTLRPQVEFWEKVYSQWGLGQYALHDDRYLDLVYEVVDLPQPTGEGLRNDQRTYLRARKDTLESQLRELERKVVSGESLTADEKALRAKIVASSAGTTGVSGAADRLRAQRGIRERFTRGIAISGRYDNQFRQIFRQAGVPEDLAYLPHVESSFQASARSSVGAAGIWQFMPATARDYMVLHPATDERLDPIISAKAAARYLSGAYSRLGDWSLAITSYNHGIGGMAKAKSQYGTDFGQIVASYDGSSFGFASRNFYAQFLAAREVARNPRRFLGHDVAREAPLPAESFTLDHPTSAPHLASYYGTSVDRLAGMNQAWSSSAVNGNAMLPAGATVWVPAGTLNRLAANGQPTTPPELLAMVDTPRPVAPRSRRGRTR